MNRTLVLIFLCAMSYLASARSFRFAVGLSHPIPFGQDTHLYTLGGFALGDWQLPNPHLRIAHRLSVETYATHWGNYYKTSGRTSGALVNTLDYYFAPDSKVSSYVGAGLGLSADNHKGGGFLASGHETNGILALKGGVLLLKHFDVNVMLKLSTRHKSRLMVGVAYKF